MNIDKPSFFVLRKSDTEPIEVHPFDNYGDAVVFYRRAYLQWHEVYMVEIVYGPRDSCNARLASPKRRRSQRDVL